MRTITPFHTCATDISPRGSYARSIKNSGVGVAYLPTASQLYKGVDVDMKD